MDLNFESLKEHVLGQSHAMCPMMRDITESSPWSKIQIDTESALVLKNIFFYLALVFRYPTEQVYSEIKGHLSAFTEFLKDYGGAVPDLPPLPDLQSEYVSLFVNNQGFVPAAPYASCYRGDGLLMDEKFFRLRQVMTASGFKLNESVHELEDHLSVLLEFCSGLLNTLAEKSTSSDRNLLGWVFVLLETSYQYIGPWVDEFSGNINSYANYEFYKVTGKALTTLFHNADPIYNQLLGFRKNETNELQG